MKLRAKLLWGHKDGGPESEVRCWGLEMKGLFSIMLLRFTPLTREAYHSHAFWSISWLLKGGLVEQLHQPGKRWPLWRTWRAGFRPIIIPRSNVHRVRGVRAVNWALTFRGPWADWWYERREDEGRYVFLTHGRKEL